MTFRPLAIVPPVLTLVALAAAGAVAFGTHPRWAELPDHGLDVILWSRRLQWVLAGVAMAASLGIVAMVVGAKRSGWWMAALAPVLMLFAQRFAGDTSTFTVADEPAFVEAAKADFVKDDDWVVSLTFADKAYAYPFAALFLEPAVVQVDRDRRLAVFWNAYANRVTAFEASADWRGRDLEVVSMPANALLVYNVAHAQFVVGLTGLTPDRKKPTGLGQPVPAGKSTFAAWRSANPAGLVMKSGRTAPNGVTPPTKRVDPIYAAVGLGTAGSIGSIGSNSSINTTPATAPATRPSTLTKPADALVVMTTRRRVTIIGTTRPVAVDVAAMSRRPAMVVADDKPVVLIRTGTDDVHAGGLAPGSGPGVEAPGVRAYLRKVDDMAPRFEARRDPKLPDVRMADLETGSLWTVGGVAVGGNPQFRGRRLAVVPFDDDVDYAVMKWWAADLELYQEPPPPPATRPAGAASLATTRPSRKTPKKNATTKPTATKPPEPAGAVPRRPAVSSGN